MFSRRNQRKSTPVGSPVRGRHAPDANASPSPAKTPKGAARKLLSTFGVSRRPSTSSAASAPSPSQTSGADASTPQKSARKGQKDLSASSGSVASSDSSVATAATAATAPAATTAPVVDATAKATSSGTTSPSVAAAGKKSTPSLTAPTPTAEPPPTRDQYAMTPREYSRYARLFPSYAREDGYVYGAEAVKLFSKSGCPRKQLRAVWSMVDDPKDNRLSEEEFACAMHLIVLVAKKGMDMPPGGVLPESLRQLKENVRKQKTDAEAAPEVSCTETKKGTSAENSAKDTKEQEQEEQAGQNGQQPDTLPPNRTLNSSTSPSPNKKVERSTKKVPSGKASSSQRKDSSLKHEEEQKSQNIGAASKSKSGSRNILDQKKTNRPQDLSSPSSVKSGDNRKGSAAAAQNQRSNSTSPPEVKRHSLKGTSPKSKGTSSIRDGQSRRERSSAVSPKGNSLKDSSPKVTSPKVSSPKDCTSEVEKSGSNGPVRKSHQRKSEQEMDGMPDTTAQKPDSCRAGLERQRSGATSPTNRPKGSAARDLPKNRKQEDSTSLSRTRRSSGRTTQARQRGDSSRETQKTQEGGPTSKPVLSKKSSARDVESRQHQTNPSQSQQSKGSVSNRSQEQKREQEGAKSASGKADPGSPSRLRKSMSTRHEEEERRSGALHSDLTTSKSSHDLNESQQQASGMAGTAGATSTAESLGSCSAREELQQLDQNDAASSSNALPSCKASRIDSILSPVLNKEEQISTDLSPLKVDSKASDATDLSPDNTDQVRLSVGPLTESASTAKPFSRTQMKTSETTRAQTTSTGVSLPPDGPEETTTPERDSEPAIGNNSSSQPSISGGDGAPSSFHGNKVIHDEDKEKAKVHCEGNTFQSHTSVSVVAAGTHSIEAAKDDFETMLPKDMEKQFVDAISRFDVDGRGYIKSVHVKHFVSSIGTKLTDEEINMLVDRVDKEQGQEISGSELKRIIEVDGLGFSSPKGATEGTASSSLCDMEVRMRDAFSCIDSEGCGYINKNQLGSLMSSAGKRFTDEELNRMVKQLDVGDDGRINFMEIKRVMKFDGNVFSSYPPDKQHHSAPRQKDGFDNAADVKSASPPVSEKRLRDMFNRIDLDGSGYIDRNDLRALMLSLGQNLSDEDLDQMVNEADETGKGRIRYSEFKRMMQGDGFTHHPSSARTVEKTENGGRCLTTTGSVDEMEESTNYITDDAKQVNQIQGNMVSSPDDGRLIMKESVGDRLSATATTENDISAISVRGQLNASTRRDDATVVTDDATIATGDSAKPKDDQMTSKEETRKFGGFDHDRFSSKEELSQSEYRAAKDAPESLISSSLSLDKILSQEATSSPIASDSGVKVAGNDQTPRRKNVGIKLETRAAVSSALSAATCPVSAEGGTMTNRPASPHNSASLSEEANGKKRASPTKYPAAADAPKSTASWPGGQILFNIGTGGGGTDSRRRNIPSNAEDDLPSQQHRAAPGRNLRRWARRVAAGATAAQNSKEVHREQDCEEHAPDVDDPESVPRFKKTETGLFGGRQRLGRDGSELEGQFDSNLPEHHVEREIQGVSGPHIQLSLTGVVSRSPLHSASHIPSGNTSIHTTSGANSVVATERQFCGHGRYTNADESDARSVGSISTASSFAAQQSPNPNVSHTAKPQQIMAALSARLSERLTDDGLQQHHVPHDGGVGAAGGFGKSGDSYYSAGISMGDGVSGRSTHVAKRRRKAKSQATSRAPSRGASATPPRAFGGGRRRHAFMTDESGSPFLGGRSREGIKPSLVPADSFRLISPSAAADDGGMWLGAYDYLVPKPKPRGEMDNRSVGSVISENTIPSNTETTSGALAEGVEDKTVVGTDAFVPSALSENGNVRFVKGTVDVAFPQDDKCASEKSADAVASLQEDERLDITALSFDTMPTAMDSKNETSRTQLPPAVSDDEVGEPVQRKLKGGEGYSDELDRRVQVKENEDFSPTKQSCEIDLIEQSNSGKGTCGSDVTGMVDQATSEKTDDAVISGLSFVPKETDFVENRSAGEGKFGLEGPAVMTNPNAASAAGEVSKENVDADDEKTLEAALFECSTLSELDFSGAEDNAFTDTGSAAGFSSSSLREIARIRWRQMLAKWRHDEMISVMIVRPTSHHFEEEMQQSMQDSEDSGSDSNSNSDSGSDSGSDSDCDSAAKDEHAMISDSLSGVPLGGSGGGHRHYLYEVVDSSQQLRNATVPASTDTGGCEHGHQQQVRSSRRFAEKSNNTSGFSPMAMPDKDIKLLSPYLSKLGPLPTCCTLRKEECVYCSGGGRERESTLNAPLSTVDQNKCRFHRWEPVGIDAGGRAVVRQIRQQLLLSPPAARSSQSSSSPPPPFTRNMTHLLHSAEMNLPCFTDFIQRIVSFAAQNGTSASLPSSVLSSPSRRPYYEVGIKKREAIQYKADTKYNGDVSLVKDVLRGSIVLPDDGALVCSLVALHKFCSKTKHRGDERKDGDVDDYDDNDMDSLRRKNISIVRIKNLFRVSPLGKVVPTDLPTGYRHILVNVRLSDGLVAELQFHLGQFYSLLGTEGYSLHHDLTRKAMALQMTNCERCGNRNPRFPVIYSVIDYHQHTTANDDSPLLCPCAEGLNTSGDGKPFLDSILHQPERTDFICFLEYLIAVARDELTQHKRDIGYHMCLYQLLQTRYVLQRRSTDKDTSIMVLDRALAISDQASALGMYGWMEYGSSCSLDRIPERPLDILSYTAAFRGRCDGDWESAAETGMTLLVRCERHLPLYHPRTIAALLDLAASLIETGKARNVKQAGRYVDRANERLAMFLEEQVSSHRISTNKRIDGVLPTEMEFVRAFCARMRALLGRPMVAVLGWYHSTVLLFHSYIGDTLSVLAKHGENNTTLLGGSGGASLRGQETQAYNISSSSGVENQSLWVIAGEYYRVALCGWLQISGRRHPNVPATTCGLARCLWEIEKKREAIDILSLAVGSSSGTAPLRSLESLDSESDLFNSNGGMGMGGDGGHLHGLDYNGDGGDSSMAMRVTSFDSDHKAELTCQIQETIARFKLAYEEALAYCLWWMAVYFVEASPNDRGRMRALSLLHASAEALQLGLRMGKRKKGMMGTTNNNNEIARQRCADTLEIVEEEAKKLFSLKLN